MFEMPKTAHMESHLMTENNQQPILYGTGNPAKLEAMRRRLSTIGVEIIGLNDLGTIIPKVSESGKTPIENARLKAIAYYEAFGRPVFSCDSGLYFDNVPESEQPGVHVRNINGRCLSDEEMLAHYSDMAKRHGNLVAKYKNAICFVIDKDNIFEAMEKSMESEPFIITQSPHKTIKKGFPLDSLSIDIKSGKYYYDLQPHELDQVAVEDGFLAFFMRILGNQTVKKADAKKICMLETTLNTRELGGYVKSDGQLTKYDSVIRSDVILHPTDNDIELLKSKGIRTIIDMRALADGKDESSPFERMKGFEYHNIPINEGSQIPESIADVPYSYMRIAESDNMPNVFRCISLAKEGVLFHCSAGKDRTGVVSAVMLMLAGVSRQEIVMNYLLTKDCNRERFKRVKETFPDIDIEIVIPHEEYVEKFMDMLCEKYCDVEGYLTSIGLTANEISMLRAKL